MAEIASWLTNKFFECSVTREFNDLGIEFVPEKIRTGGAVFGMDLPREREQQKTPRAHVM
jgi:hypothetical protein